MKSADFDGIDYYRRDARRRPSLQRRDAVVFIRPSNDGLITTMVIIITSICNTQRAAY